MNDEDLKKIEESLNIVLPDYYRSTMLNYPFPEDSFVSEFSLPDDPGLVIENNDLSCREVIADFDDFTIPFFIGGDGGEELYFIDLSSDESTVFVFFMESGEFSVLSGNWTEYLEKLQWTCEENNGHKDGEDATS